jgi:hypothetical protein
MSSKILKSAVAAVALLSASALCNRVDAAGMPGVAAPAGGGAAVGGGAMSGGGASFGGGAAFGGANGLTVTPSAVNAFPFFGGGGFFGAPFVNVTQPLILPPPAPPPQTSGPIQLHQANPFGHTMVQSTRQIFVNGTPTTVTSPMVVEYNWPSKAAVRPHHTFMRLRAKIHRK